LILSKPNYIKIYGHRGARGDMPENSLSGFKYIFDNNFFAFETDVLISKDKIPLIAHDFYLNPYFTKDQNGEWIKNKKIKIYDLNFQELLDYDIGTLDKTTSYGKRFKDQKSIKNQRIIKLDELFDLIKKYPKENMFINLEIKSTPEEKNLTPSPKDMISIIKKALSKYDYFEKILISSFDWRILKECKLQMPDVLRGHISLHTNLKTKPKTVFPNSPWLNTKQEFNVFEIPKIVKKQGGHVWCPFYRDVTKQNVEMAHDLGLGVNVWTVNSEREMLRMIKYGVDGIITDFPNKLKRVCENNKVQWF